MSDDTHTPIPSLQHATETSGDSEAPQISDSTPVVEEALANLLSEYLAEPAPGPVMGTFDGEAIELTDENKQWMAETAAAAGRGLTIKGNRQQHYMTFSPPHPGTTMVRVARTPPESPPCGPSPVSVQAPVPPIRSPRGDNHVGAGIRKRPHKCAYCPTTFSSVARRTAHVEKHHADKLANLPPQN